MNENEVNDYLHRFFGPYEDSFQDAWVKILENRVLSIGDVLPVAKKVKNRAIRKYLEKQRREKSLQDPIGNSGDGGFTLESVLEDRGRNGVADDENHSSHALCEKVVDFLIGEYLKKRSENVELRKREAEFRIRRLRLREESLQFKRDRFDAWKRLMEEKGKQKELQTALHIQLQRERLESRKKELLLKKKRLMRGRA